MLWQEQMCQFILVQMQEHKFIEIFQAEWNMSQFIANHY
jgi:hypothetical protein